MVVEEQFVELVPVAEVVPVGEVVPVVPGAPELLVVVPGTGVV